MVPGDGEGAGDGKPRGGQDHAAAAPRHAAGAGPVRGLHHPGAAGPGGGQDRAVNEIIVKFQTLQINHLLGARTWVFLFRLVLVREISLTAPLQEDRFRYRDAGQRHSGTPGQGQCGGSEGAQGWPVHSDAAGLRDGGCEGFECEESGEVSICCY